MRRLFKLSTQLLFCIKSKLCCGVLTKVAIKHDGGIANNELVGTKPTLNLHEVCNQVSFYCVL
jgi:hypothetical protein